MIDVLAMSKQAISNHKLQMRLGSHPSIHYLWSWKGLRQNITSTKKHTRRIYGNIFQAQQGCCGDFPLQFMFK